MIFSHAKEGVGKMKRKYFFFWQHLLVLIAGLTPLFAFTTIDTITRRDFIQEMQAHIAWGNSFTVAVLGMLGVYGLSILELGIALALLTRQSGTRKTFGYILLVALLLTFIVGRFVIGPVIDHLLPCCD